jgi:hypothetical protein
MLEASDKEVDYSQDPSSNEVEGSWWSIKDPLTETAEHFTNGMGKISVRVSMLQTTVL